ncbi:hypothetical protein [Dactylosporangium sp. CA-139066]|uniref:hypothetical protein n=1 Tax=Dactylosporangium sp. CA-139066 TaxID=3239930 RepID=UPI003D89C4E6
MTAPPEVNQPDGASPWDPDLWDAYEAGVDMEPPDDRADEPAPPETPLSEAEQRELMHAVANLPEEFWEARERFRAIRQAAWRNGCSGDVAMLTVMCRTSAMVSPKLIFDLGRGPGSLNLFGGAVGPSGGGKSQAVEVGQEIVIAPAYLVDADGNIDPDKFKDGIPLGTGEGLAEAYMGTAERETGELHTRNSANANKGDPKTEKVRAQVRHNVFYYLDEGETLTKMMKERQGATIGQALRTAWVGGPLGQQNARDETTRLIPRRSYSCGMVIGYQPKTVQDLLGDGGPGTPQRFLWASAIDPSLPSTRPDAQRPFWLPLHDDSGQAITGTIGGPKWIADQLWARRVDVVRGKQVVEELDSHVDLMRCKLAALLAVIDGRMEVSDEDWQLSEVLWTTSCETRDRMVEFGRRQAQMLAAQQTAAHVDREEKAHVARRTVDARAERIARWIGRRIHERGEATHGATKRAMSAEDRPFFDVGLEHALAQQWVSLDNRALRPGSARPV